MMELVGFLFKYISMCILLLFFAVFIYILLKKKDKRNRRKLMLSEYYFLICISIILNFIYAFSGISEVNTILYELAIFFSYFGGVFLAIFCMLMYKWLEDKTLSIKVQILILIIYAIAYSVLFFIPGGITFSAGTSWKPAISALFFIYVTIVHLTMTLFLVIFSLRTLTLLKAKGEEIFISRWKQFILGWALTNIFTFFTMLTDYLGDDTLRMVWNLLGAVIIILAAWLTFSFLGRKFQK